MELMYCFLIAGIESLINRIIYKRIDEKKEIKYSYIRVYRSGSKDESEISSTELNGCFHEQTSKLARKIFERIFHRWKICDINILIPSRLIYSTPVKIIPIPRPESFQLRCFKSNPRSNEE